MSEAPTPLWRPSPALVERSRMTEFMRWLEAERGLRFDDYDALWRWSVTDLDAFWRAIWDFFEVRADGEPEPVLGSREMPGARWFPGTALNYAEHVFAGKDDAEAAILHASELRELGELTWGELREQVAALAASLRAMGVERGDRVVAYMPNVPETIVAFLAAASLGAVWSSCSPDFGPASVVDRFAQIEPKVLFCVDGYRYGGKDFDRTATVAALQEAMPSLEHTVLLPYLDPEPDHEALDARAWSAVLAEGAGAELRFERVPFDHPLWVLYSSGTTGLPKAIVQSQGGILIEHLKKLGLHLDAHPGDRLFWFTTTGWMMWNFLLSGLLTGAAIVLYDGNPGHPDLSVLWDLAERAGVTTFGTSASYISACMKAGVEPARGRDLGALKAVGSTGSPLSPEGFDWVYEHLGADTWLFSTSGGTDVCTAFVGGVPLLPVYRGELQGRALGCAVEAWDEDGHPVLEEVGELVITEPMPSMPIYFWETRTAAAIARATSRCSPGSGATATGSKSPRAAPRSSTGARTRRSTAAGSAWGPPRSTAPCSPSRTSSTPSSSTSRAPGTEGWMPLFVVLREGAELDEELPREIARRVREQCSPRHVPDEVFAIEEVPRTLSGKVLEVPVKRILMGTDPAKAASRDSLANPAALDYFVEMANRLEV